MSLSNIPWTKEDHELLISVAGKGLSIEQIRQKYFPNRSYCALNSRLYVYGIENNYYHRKYSQDDNFWSVPNELNCYWAGVMAADGHIAKDKRYGTKSFQWNISAKDRNLMQRFLLDTKSNDIIESKFKKSKITGVVAEMIRVRINSLKWVEDLENNFKIINNKHMRTDIPDLNENLVWCFIRGYIDGDGHITHYKSPSRKEKNRRCLRIGIGSCSVVILEKIMALVDSKFSSYQKKRTRKLFQFKDKKMKTLYVSGQRAVQMFLFMSKLNAHCLDRKWKNPEILALVRERVAERPEAYKDFL